ncbi:MAG: hypothetical protein H5T68_02850 [Chloroflexi bacterium]|nr:hypothetical protein [Chloroflexota bacterium]
MTGDLVQRIQSAYNKIEEMAKDIPGYKGYKDKEVRREADKLVRLQVARGFEQQMRRLYRVETHLANTGRLGVLMVLDRALMRLQFLIDRLKTASYGYAGLFDAAKVKEAELDALYNYDAAMLDSVAKIKALVDEVAAADQDEEVVKAGNALLEALEEVNDTFSKRQDVILAAPSTEGTA